MSVPQAIVAPPPLEAQQSALKPVPMMLVLVVAHLALKPEGICCILLVSIQNKLLQAVDTKIDMLVLKL